MIKTGKNHHSVMFAEKHEIDDDIVRGLPEEYKTGWSYRKKQEVHDVIVWGFSEEISHQIAIVIWSYDCHMTGSCCL